MLQPKICPLPSRLLVTAALVALAACQSTGSADSVLHPDGRVLEATLEAPSEDHEIEQYLDQYIRGTLLVDGRQRVQLDLKNNSPGSLAFAYQVEWLDREGGIVVDREALWTPLVLAGGEAVSLELKAPEPQAESWRLRAVRLPAKG